MKIAVLSDIHGNLPALKLVLEDIAKQKAEEIYSLGDQIGFFPYLNETLSLLDRTGVICLQGNHEESNIEYRLGDVEEVKGLWYYRHYNWMVNQQGQRDFGTLPRVFQIEREGVQILMTHKEEWAECPEGGLHLFGHTHEKFFYRSRSKYTLNPGAVGDPLGSLTIPEAHYALLEILDGIIQVKYRALPYAAEPIWQDFIESGCYEEDPILSRLIMEMIETGVSNSIMGRYLRHARGIMQAEGINSEHIPNDIWNIASENFPWQLPNKFEDLLKR